jgi:DNA helicase-2/ATP-dependent DNA helicase PcrA
MEDYLSKLNTQQREAVEYLDGPQLVIAGAGSGKTRVLTFKIVHLIAKGYEPWRLMALTFTNKAANEMRERIQQLVGEATARRLWMGTFHSIFSRILRQNADKIGFQPSFTIYDSDDSRALIKTIVRDMNLDDKIYKPAVVQNAISMAKNALISPSQYAVDRDLMEADRRAKRGQLVDIYRTYRHRCQVAGAMDFDDLLYYTNVLFRDHPEVCRHYSEYFQYILVDEYQDTNFAQHCIVSQLCKGSRNLTMVGDDAQSIYSFRGANIRNILNLRKAYPDLQIFKLEQNYRSTRNIVAAANSLIDKNSEQIRKQVFSENDFGAKIEVCRCYSDFDEASLVADRIARLQMSTHDSLNDFAILYRTNAQSRRFEESLRKRRLSYRIYGGVSFYQRKEVKDAIAYFRLATNPNDDEALRRVINYPARGIGETTLKKLVHAAIERGISVWGVLNDPADLNVNGGTMKKLDAFRELIDGFNKQNSEGVDAAQLTRSIYVKTRILTSLITDNTPESVSQQENLMEMQKNVEEFVAGRLEEGNEAVSMTDFLAEVSLATDQDEKDTANERVTMMTVHAAKGLEFNNVIVVGVEEELFPSAMACDSLQAIEEERRLLYVAITRAKNFCMLSYASSRYRNGQTMITRPSRFLRDIDPQFLKMVQGSDIEGDSRVNPMENYRESYHSAGAGRLFNPTYRPAYPDRKSAVPSNGRGGTCRSTQLVTNAATPQSAADSSSEFALHDISELYAGLKIWHGRFGTGVIDAVEDNPSGDKITVTFKNAERKTLLLRFARFKIIQ